MAKIRDFQNNIVRAPRKPQLVLSGFGLQALKTKAYGFGEDEPNERDSLPTSYLGTPVFSNVDFIEGSYRDLEGNVVDYLKTGEVKGLQVDTVLISVNQSKIIKRTQIQGRNGSVKEYISDGDFDVTIRGAIVDPSPSRYPEEQVLKLLEVCKVQKEIEISSFYLNDVFGISNLVITGYKIPQSEGVQNMQLFELSCLSDDPIELTINR